MGSWGSYSSIFNIGHKAVQDLLSQEVNVEEKIDGSQFSFGLVEANFNSSGEPVDIVHRYVDGLPYSLKIRSKGAVMHIDAPEKMFSHGADTVKSLADQLVPGWTYRGEYLAKPKHNALAYDRVPNGHIILFDINSGEQEYLSYENKVAEATRLGLECTPLLDSGRIGSIEQFRGYLNTVSVLGGQNIEGVVIKPKGYNLYGLDKKVLMGKFVSEAFKEVHRKAWGESNPAGKDIIGLIGSAFKTPARWQKARIHLAEAGFLVNDVKDIGFLIREVPEDIKKEHEDEIKEMLFKWAWPSIRRIVTGGLPDWYKDQLLKDAFENQPSEQMVTGGENGTDPVVVGGVGNHVD